VKGSGRQSQALKDFVLMDGSLSKIPLTSRLAKNLDDTAVDANQPVLGYPGFGVDIGLILVHFFASDGNFNHQGSSGGMLMCPIFPFALYH
jgi:hypothetical protein